MNRALRLFMLLFTFACCPALGLAAEPSALRVVWTIFSGRPDPSFVISDPAVLRQIVSTFTALPLHPTLTEKDSAARPQLGYRGFHVTPTGMDGVAWFEVYGNTVEVASSASVGGTQAKSFRFDKETALEQLLFEAARAQDVLSPTPVTPTPPTTVVVPMVERSVTINLVAPFPTVVATPIRPPVTVHTGTRVKLVATQAAENATGVRWIKDSRELPGTGGRTLEIASASPGDSGLYWALVGLGGGQSTTSVQADLLVTTREGQRLLNLSVLSQIGSEQRVLTSGFTIEAGAANSCTLILVRAVGPALAALGVDGPLRAPQLRVMNASGTAVAPANIPFSLPTVAAATERVGAFALPANSTDIALLYYLPAGAFTAQVSSADTGTGSVLLEVYEVPLE